MSNGKNNNSDHGFNTAEFKRAVARVHDDAEEMGFRLQRLLRAYNSTDPDLDELVKRAREYRDLSTDFNEFVTTLINHYGDV